MLVLFQTVYCPVMCECDCMSDSVEKEHLHEATLCSVMKEMATPRLAASVREGIEGALAHAKFRVGLLLHNRNTKEDGSS
jgi:hypothetical protein